MTTRRLAVLAFGAALAVACAPRYLTGTEIRDTPETRAVATLLETYRQAMEKRDAAAVLALTTPDYFDNSGTLDPADDIDRAGLEKRLGELKDLTDLRLLLTLRGVQVTKDGQAQAEVAFEQFYRVTTPNGLIARRDTDLHRMTLKKVDGKWLFTSGL